MTTSTRRVVVVQDENQAAGHLPGQRERFLLRGADTGGVYALSESVLPPGVDAPLHVHRHEDESFYVISGTIEAICGEQTIVLTDGSSIFLPRDIPHRIKNIGATPAKVLMILSPPQLESFFDQMIVAAAEGALDPQRMAELARPYGVEILEPHN
jgi:quercetin dioxygenase-like cupin family protein